MKKFNQTTMATMMLMTLATPAFAVDTTRTYSSGILVGVFLAFCALIVVFQLMPTLVLLYGFIKGLFKKEAKSQASR